VSPQPRPRQDRPSSSHRGQTSETCLLAGSALPRGSEYNRRTGGGTTARPGLYGGCRGTGIPTVETTGTHSKGAGKSEAILRGISTTSNLRALHKNQLTMS